MRILNIAFYRFLELKNLPELRAELRLKCQELGLKGSILLSSEGINGFLAGPESQVLAFKAFINTHPVEFALDFKDSYSDTIPFQKLLIKIKKEIIPLGDPSIQPAQTSGDRISPQELKKWFDENRDFNILDTRNDYEIQFGTFEKAIQLNGLRHFRNFPELLKQLPEGSKSKPLVMFCTGGIRCEKASVVAMQQGYPEVLQLEGGILKYFEECGGEHYRGDCFVFDERVALQPNLQAVDPSTTLALNDGRRDLTTPESYENHD